MLHTLVQRTRVCELTHSSGPIRMGCAHSYGGLHTKVCEYYHKGPQAPCVLMFTSQGPKGPCDGLIMKHSCKAVLQCNTLGVASQPLVLHTVQCCALLCGLTNSGLRPLLVVNNTLKGVALQPLVWCRIHYTRGLWPLEWYSLYGASPHINRSF